MQGPEFYSNTSTGRKFIKLSSQQRGLVDASGRPMKNLPRPVGIYSPDGRSMGGGSMMRQAGMRKFASADNALMTPEVRNPLLNIVNFFLPYNYRVLAQWIRYYDKFHPMVGNCLDLHGSFPISKFDLKLEKEDEKVLRVYEECADQIDLFNRILEISREYELLGEVYPYLHWNESSGYFDSLILLNPDFIHVDMHPLAFGKDPIIKLEPDELLKVIATSTNPEDVEIRNEMDPMVIAAVLTEQNIRLDPFSVCQIARKSSPYEPRGTSIVLRCIKDLLYEDKLREAQYAVADGLITPKLIWKLGDPQYNWMPNEQQLHDFRMLLQAQAHDPLSAIVTHYGLQVDVVGYNGKILPIVPEFEFVEDRILTALYTNKALTHGEGPTYANASIAMEALQGRYLAKREKLEEFVKNKIWKKIALLNEFYEPLTEAQSSHGIRPSKADRKLNIPEMKWKQKLKLVEDMAKKQMVIALRNTMGMGVPGISMKKIYDELDIDYETEITALREEAAITKELKELYGVATPLTAPSSPTSTPSDAPDKMPSIKSLGKPQQMSLPGTAPSNKPSSGGTGGTQEPGGNMKTKEPGSTMTGASLRRREAEWKLKSGKDRMANGAGKVPVMARPPVQFLEKDGRLRDLESVLETTEQELSDSDL